MSLEVVSHSKPEQGLSLLEVRFIISKLNPGFSIVLKERIAMCAAGDEIYPADL